MCIYAIILAGGKGERFWPLSRLIKPKQLLPLVSDKPMLVDTVDRIIDFISMDKIIIVANKEIEDELKKLFPNIKLAIEPFGRNTLCAIGYAATFLSPEDIMVVLPSDHYIPNKELFLSTLKIAIKFAKNGYLMTFGIIPTRPDVNYGYIELGEKISNSVHLVKSFKEKPNLKQAKDFLSSSNFLWNSGIFVWKQEKILNEISIHLPEFYNTLMNYKEGKISLIDLYNSAPNISIDYSIMEKSSSTAVVKSYFVWDDVGSWLAMERLFNKNKDGNVILGTHYGVKTKNCIIVNKGEFIATLGVENLVIVNSGDVIFIANKRDVVDIKKFLSEMREKCKLNKYF